MKGISKKLKKAMSEINDILKDYDIAGCVFLSDGLGNGEFSNYIEQPTWSTIRFIKREKGIAVHLKAYNKTMKEESNKTISALYNIQGMLTNMWLFNDQVTKDIEQRIELQKGESKIIPLRDQNNEND